MLIQSAIRGIVKAEESLDLIKAHCLICGEVIFHDPNRCLHGVSKLLDSFINAKQHRPRITGSECGCSEG